MDEKRRKGLCYTIVRRCGTPTYVCENPRIYLLQAEIQLWMEQENNGNMPKAPEGREEKEYGNIHPSNFWLCYEVSWKDWYSFSRNFSGFM